jgi:hypothetical protein
MAVPAQTYGEALEVINLRLHFCMKMVHNTHRHNGCDDWLPQEFCRIGHDGAPSFPESFNYYVDQTNYLINFCQAMEYLIFCYCKNDDLPDYVYRMLNPIFRYSFILEYMINDIEAYDDCSPSFLRPPKDILQMYLPQVPSSLDYMAQPSDYEHIKWKEWVEPCWLFHLIAKELPHIQENSKTKSLFLALIIFTALYDKYHSSNPQEKHDFESYLKGCPTSMSEFLSTVEWLTNGSPTIDVHKNFCSAFATNRDQSRPKIFWEFQCNEVASEEETDEESHYEGKFPVSQDDNSSDEESHHEGQFPVNRSDRISEGDNNDQYVADMFLHQLEKMGCFCDVCDDVMCAISLPRLTILIAKRKQLIEPEAHNNGLWCVKYQSKDQFHAIDSFLKNDLKKDAITRNWVNTIRTHYKQKHPGNKYPASIVMKQCFGWLRKLYEEETLNPSSAVVEVPRVHSFYSFKKTIIGSKSDSDLSKRYRHLLETAVVLSDAKHEMRQLIHLYWEYKC